MHDAIYATMIEKKRRRKAIHERVGESVAATQHQQVVAASLISSSSKKQCGSESSLKEALRAKVLPRAHQRMIPSQIFIDAALSKLFVQSDLRAVNNSRLTTAIADMCNAQNLQDRLVGTRIFHEVIEAVKMVGPDYNIPNRNDIGGWLLQKNTLAYKQGNYEEVTKDGPKFGYLHHGRRRRPGG